MSNTNYIYFVTGFAVAMIICTIVNIVEPKRLEISIVEPITAKLDVSDLRIGELQ